MRKLFFILSFLFFVFKLNAQTCQLGFKFFNEKSLGSVESVQIGIDSNWIGSSNQYGYFSIKISVGAHTVSIEHPSFNSIEMNLSLDKDTFINIYLSDSNKIFYRKVVKKSSANNFDFGKKYFSSQSLKQLPFLLSEPDPFKAIQLSTGVSNVQEFNSGLYVRGGNIDQTMILYDEAPVYNSLHYLGFFSTFDVNAIQSINLYKNALPLKFGGRGSSIVEVNSKEGDYNKHHQTFEIGFTQAKILLEGPIKNKKISYLLSSRLGYPLLLASENLSSGINGLTNYFYDINAKITHRINRKNNVFYSTFISKDKFTPNGNTVLGGLDYTSSIKNQTATIRWNYIPHNSLFVNTSLSYSNYQNGLIADELDVLLNNKNSIRNYLLKSDFEKSLNLKTQLNFGFQSLFYNGKTGNLKTYKNVLDSAEISNRGMENSIYWAINRTEKKHRFNVGGRLSLYSAILPQATVFINLEPRASYQYTIDKNKYISASFDKSIQYQHFISQNLVTFPTDFWVNSSKSFKPQKVFAYSIGYHFNANNWTVNSDVFYKKYKNTFDYKDGADFSNIAEYAQQLENVKSHSYGLEIEIQKTFKENLNFNANYTYSRSLKKSLNINQGNWYPSNFDRPHQFNLNSTWNVNSKLKLNALFVLQSGRPISIRELPLLYSERNAYRLPLYHRLDLGLSYCRKPNKFRFKSTWNFSVYNAYNQQNVYFVYWKHSEQQFKSLTLLPILPSLSYSLKIN